MEISKLTVEDGRAIQSLEGILKSVVLERIKPTECAAVGSAVAWFANLMKQYGNVWQAENKVVPAEKAEVPTAPDGPIKVKAYSPGKVK